MSQRFRIHRRHVLRGLGASIALPMLDVMVPHSLLRPNHVEAQAATPPKRMVVFVSPNGILMEQFTPAAAGTGWTVPRVLTPFANRLNEINVISGLSQAKLTVPWYSSSLSNLNQTTFDVNHHPLSASILLTSVAPKVAPLTAEDSAQGIDNWVTSAGGPSVDYVASERMGATTRFANLTVYTEHDSGVVPANHRYTWKGVGAPGASLTRPRDLFDTLFSDVTEDPAAATRAQKINKSILDAVSGSVSELIPKVSVADRQRLDEHMTSIRDLERRVAGSIVACTKPADPGPASGYDENSEYEARVNLQFSLLTMALKCDLTRVVVVGLGATGNGIPVEHLGVMSNDHGISHFDQGGDVYAKVSEYKVGLFAKFLDLLKQVPDGTGTLVDQSALAFISEFSDGGLHCPDFLPVIVAGGLGGMVGGKHIVVPCTPLDRASLNTPRLKAFGNGGYTPVANLWLTMLKAVGANVDTFGDSTGTISGLWA